MRLFQKLSFTAATDGKTYYNYSNKKILLCEIRKTLKEVYHIFN